MSKTNQECPSCGYINSEGYRHCPSCTFPLMLIAGKYRIEAELAEGGMAVVYLVHHTGLDYDTERVVKVVKPEVFSYPGTEQRFRQEIQITAALSQQNQHIVRIYDDFGEEEGLGNYYIMEHLQGSLLCDLMETTQRLPVHLALHIFYQTSLALLEAHKNNIVHRDLKPENIFLITRGDDDHFVKLLDFGIARPQQRNTSITRGIVGTPLYMSPEQCQSQPVDQRSDVYAMGIMLYNMLAGDMPYVFESDEQGGVSPLVVLSAHIMQKPIPIQKRVPELAWLQPVLQTALQKSPDARYRDMVQFWLAIQKHAPSSLILPNIEAASRSSVTIQAHKSPAETPLPPERSQDYQLNPTTFFAPKRLPFSAVLAMIACLVILIAVFQQKKKAQPPAKPMSALPKRVAKIQPRPKAKVAGREKATEGRKPKGVDSTPYQPRKRLSLRKKTERKTRQKRRRRIRRRTRRRRIRRSRKRYRKRKRTLLAKRSSRVGICGAARTGYRWIFARVRTPSSGRIRIRFYRCSKCRAVQKKGGYCLQIRKTSTMKISAVGYQPCRVGITAKVKMLEWRLRLQRPNELADEDYPCTKTSP